MISIIVITVTIATIRGAKHRHPDGYHIYALATLQIQRYSSRFRLHSALHWFTPPPINGYHKGLLWV